MTNPDQNLDSPDEKMKIFPYYGDVDWIDGFLRYPAGYYP